MARKFTLATEEFQAYDTDFIGISKDNYLDENAPGSEHGIDGDLRVGEHTSGKEYHIVIEIVMPEQGDVPAADVLVKAELLLYSHTSTTDPILVAVIKITDIWDEGQSQWNEAQDGPTPWEKGDGAVKSRKSTLEEGEQVIDSVWITTVPIWNTFDLTPILTFGGIASVVLFPINMPIANRWFGFRSKQASAPFATLRPKLKITYRDYSPDAFVSEDDQLTIEPYENNPEQPILRWGGTDSVDFARWKVWRETAPITDVSALTPIATITDPAINEYVDVASLSENQIYYYLVTVEDGNNTGNNATFSKNVSFKRPDNTHSEATEGIDVGDLVTITLNSSILCKKAYIEWGDSVEGYWIESEVETNQFILEHVYSETGAKIVKARLESSDGYWSDLDTVCTKTVSDINPIAILVCRPLKVVSGETVRCIGARSQPVAADATIDQYDYYVNGSWNNDEGPVFEVVPASTQEIRLRITTSTSKVTTQGVGEGEDIEVISGDPVDLVFSRATSITTRQEERDSKAEVLSVYDGIGETDLPYSITNVNYDINGLSATEDFKADIDLIRAFHEAQTFTRITGMDEQEGVTVQLDGRIAGYQITQSTDTYVSWRLTFRVFIRTEV